MLSKIKYAAKTRSMNIAFINMRWSAQKYFSLRQIMNIKAHNYVSPYLQGPWATYVILLCSVVAAKQYL